MKISKLYSNQPDIFEPIKFTQGLNIILAEIRLPQNKEKNTHNLGKTTLGSLIDFCLLKEGRDFFLLKHLELFEDFVFFLEIELENKSFITIQRSVKKASRISFQLHQDPCQNLSSLPTSSWTHQNVTIQRAQTILDGILDWQALGHFSYRKILKYLLRSQEDFQDIFQPKKLSSSKHVYWKPFLAHILGFHANLISTHYEKEDEISEKKKAEKTIKTQLSTSIEDLNKIDAQLLLQRKDVQKQQDLLDNFNFNESDRSTTQKLVNDTNEEIANLNKTRYFLSQNKKTIISSLKEEKILFTTKEATQLFRETGILFEGQIKKNFEQLISFNKAITEERFGYPQRRAKRH